MITDIIEFLMICETTPISCISKIGGICKYNGICSDYFLKDWTVMFYSEGE